VKGVRSRTPAGPAAGRAAVVAELPPEVALDPRRPRLLPPTRMAGHPPIGLTDNRARTHSITTAFRRVPPPRVAQLMPAEWIIAGCRKMTSPGPPTNSTGWTCVDGSALSFVTTICSTYRESLYKREMGRQNDRMPSTGWTVATISSKVGEYRSFGVKPQRCSLSRHSYSRCGDVGQTQVPPENGGTWSRYTMPKSSAGIESLCGPRPPGSERGKCTYIPRFRCGLCVRMAATFAASATACSHGRICY
jgi:hypothetical protein